MIFYHKDHECSTNSSEETEENLDYLKKKDNVRIIPKKSQNNITFEGFLNFFPPVELPYTITSDTQRMIGRHNEPLSAQWMFNFVLDKEGTIDEFTEFIPCFALPNTEGFSAVVYWEAGIEGTAYHLITYSKTGVLINKTKIAGTGYNQEGILQMVCTIGEDLMISCVEGRLDTVGSNVAVSENKTHNHTFFQVSSDGEIIVI